MSDVYHADPDNQPDDIEDMHDCTEPHTAMPEPDAFDREPPPCMWCQKPIGWNEQAQTWFHVGMFSLRYCHEKKGRHHAEPEPF